MKKYFSIEQYPWRVRLELIIGSSPLNIFQTEVHYKIIIVLLISVFLFSCSKKNSTSLRLGGKGHTQAVILKKPPLDSPQLIIDSSKNIKSLQAIDSLAYFKSAYYEIRDMLEGKNFPDFKRAVFAVENAYYLGTLDFVLFNNAVEKLKSQCGDLTKGHFIKYDLSDSIDVQKNAAIFAILTSQKIISIDTSLFSTRFYGYDFDDPSGRYLYENTFVSRLLNQKIGNCQSMSYLYKILALELQTPAWLALAPMHIYIKTRNKKIGFYNTELTTGSFPSDAKIANSGYISTEAMVNGLYMDTLSAKKTIALCMYDLARATSRKFGNTQSNFVKLCLASCLEYYPNYINALIFKARLSKLNYIKDPNETTKAKMEQNYIHFLKLGYTKMPEENYQNWLHELKKGKENQLLPLNIYNNK